MQLLMQLPPSSGEGPQADRAGSGARGTHVEAPDPDQPAQHPSVSKAPTIRITRTQTGVAATAATEQDNASGRRDGVLCTPVAAGAHSAGPMSHRTRAKTAQEPCSDAARREAELEAAADAGEAAAGVTDAPASPSPPAGQNGQQGSPIRGAPQQDASCGYNDWDVDLEAALRHSDQHALAAAAKGRQPKIPPQSRQHIEAIGRSIVSTAAGAQVRDRDTATASAQSRSAVAAATASAAAACPKQPEQAPQRPAITPHNAMHWGGGPLLREEATLKPAQAQSNCPLGVAADARVARSPEARLSPAEAPSDRPSSVVPEDVPQAERQPAAAKPVESDCPSMLVGDPSMAFVGLGGLVWDVQGDQGPQSPRQADEPDASRAEGRPVVAKASHAQGMLRSSLVPHTIDVWPSLPDPM